MQGIKQGNTTVYTMTYDSIDTLLERQSYMKETLNNFLEKDNLEKGIDRELIETSISFTESKYLLNLKVGLKENK